MSKNVENRHTAMHDAHAPLTGTCVFGLSSLKIGKNNPSLANEYSSLLYPIIFINADAVIPKNAQTYMNPATH